MSDTAKRCEQAIDLVMGSMTTVDAHVLVIAIDGKGRTAIHTREKREGSSVLDAELAMALRFLQNALDVAYCERLASARLGPPTDDERPTPEAGR